MVQEETRQQHKYTATEACVLGVTLLCLKTPTKQDWENETAVKDETGKTWFRLSAEACSEKVLEVLNTKLSEKVARTSQQKLVDNKLLLRRQGLRHPHDRTYSYATPDDLTEEGKLQHRGALKLAKGSAEANLLLQLQETQQTGKGFG